MLRLIDLDGTALSVDEAARAYDAYQVAEGEVPETWRGDLAAAATSYLFRIFGDTETVARIFPALAGVGLVGALALTRPFIGPMAALVTAALVTFSPLFVLAARSVSEVAVGPIVCVLIVASLFAYLRNPRTAVAFALFVFLALAPLTDAIAVLVLMVVPVFLALEALVFKNRALGDSFRAFRSSPVQWASAVLVIAAAAQLGVTHFGTSLEGDLPGVQSWTEMFGSSSGSKPGEYFIGIALAYEWPILLLGASAFVHLVWKAATRRALEPIDRFLLLWTAAAAITLAFVTDREAEQLLLLLLPLSLLGGRFVAELVSTMRGELLSNAWLSAAALILFIGGAALLMTQWASGNASTAEEAVLVAILPACLLVLAVTFLRSRAEGVATTLIAFGVVAAAFVTHTSLAVAFGDGTEFAVDQRLTARAEELRTTLDRLSEERDSTVVVDREFVGELGWTLRNSRVGFGIPTADDSILVSVPELGPPGFAGLPDIWRVSEGWYPDDLLALRPMWRWFLYREPFGETDFSEVRIYVRTI
jgi:hypothetical protein